MFGFQRTKDVELLVGIRICVSNLVVCWLPGQPAQETEGQTVAASGDPTEEPPQARSLKCDEWVQV